MEAKEGEGYVYILTNPSFKENWVKIGYSARPVDVRSKELDNTAVPLPFEIYATLKTKKYIQAEKLVHRYIERFTNLRVRDKREFFMISPDVALSIFHDVSLLLDDAEIDEVYKKESIEIDSNQKHTATTPIRTESKIWMIPYNSKYFDLQKCFDKFGQVYWAQYFNFQKGDTGYIYSSNPDSAIRYKYEVIAHDLPYSSKMDVEIEFYTNPNDFNSAKEHNRFSLLKLTGETKTNRLSLMNLLDNGMNGAPRGALNLSHESYKELLNYIESNFEK